MLSRLRISLILALVALAWANRFVQDDAFISFRYAKHLVEGHGLVWNVGEPIEGYTNFLWVLVVALGLKLGVDPVAWSQGVGLLLFAGTLWLIGRLVNTISGDATASLAALVVLGTNYTVSIYATGGLETQLQTFFCVVVAERTVALLRERSWPGPELTIVSLAMAGAVLTRLDSALVCAVASLFCLLAWRREAPTTVSRRAVVLFVPALLLVGSWLLWKLAYYGDVLPNTFRAKGALDLARGVGYFHRYAASYLLYPFLLVALVSLRRFVATARAELWMLLTMVAANLAYAVAIGGDFMEFRFLVLPLYLATPLGAWLLVSFVTRSWLRWGLAVLLVVGSLHHVRTFRYDTDDEIEPRAMLEGHLTDPHEQWIRVGKTLGAALDRDSGVRIATTAAGAIPYYSNLTTIDMLGMSDRFVATSGIVFGTLPGHTRIAPLSYLQERGVHLAICHPTLVPVDRPVFDGPWLPREDEEAAPEFPLLEIPLDGSWKLVVWYLQADPHVDAAIARGGWKLTPPRR